MATSDMNEFMQNMDERILQCAVCVERIKNPVTLNCLHSYCLSCLENWTKTKGQVTCPTCRKQYRMRADDLKKLPPNTFLNNLLEMIEQFANLDQKKCVCEKETALNYCQECQNYLCTTCTEYHRKLGGTSKHKLHSVENLQSMSQEEFNNLHPLLCSIHNEPLKYFCNVCNIPICIHCTIIEHKELEGKHKVISISDAYKNIKETAEKLKETAQHCKDKLEYGLKEVIENKRKLEQSREQSLKDIDDHEKEMITKIIDSADNLRIEVDRKYRDKKKILDVQMNEIKTTKADVDLKVNFLDQLLKSNKATAVESSDKVIKALKDRIEKLPKTEPDDNGQIYYFENKTATQQLLNIGKVTELGAADELTLQGGEPVTQGQNIVVRIIKSIEIRKNKLKATWRRPTGKKVKAKIDENSNGDYSVTIKCTSAGDYRLDVSVDDKQIKNSPMIINVEKNRLMNTIQVNGLVYDVVRCDNDNLLISCKTNKILKYNQSGEYICDLTLPQGIVVYSINMMKKHNIIFSDHDNGCIKVSNMKGEVIKSFGEDVLKNPIGLHVDEVSKVVYVADCGNNDVFIFDINSGKIIRKIGSSGQPDGKMSGPSDVHLTRKRNILVLQYTSGTLQLFDSKGRFIKVLVKVGDDDGCIRNPRGVAVDVDDNIIITSEHKVQLFSSDGKFIKRIDKKEDKIKYPMGLNVISFYPRKIAVANYSERNVKIFNY